MPEQKRPDRIIYKKFSSIEEAAKFAFSSAYYEYNYRKLRDIGSPYIEDIVSSHLLLRESSQSTGTFVPAVYFTSKFPNKIQAEVARICGQNFGMDKLSHFFSDGFLMYNKLRQKDLRNLDEVRQLSDLFERSTMGPRCRG